MQINIKSSLVFLVLVIFIFSPTFTLAETNLIANNSVETSSNSFLQGQWGENNAQFVYQNVGHNSQHSLYVKMSNWKSGDAKWYFEPTEVLPDTDYSFSDYFKSNVKTSIVAMSLDNNGNPTYFDISINVPASPSAWKKISYDFHTLPNTKTLTIFHLIQKNGWLSTDDYSLTLSEKSTITDFVPNNSLEVPSSNDSNIPDKWAGTSWGVNSPVYEYVNDAHDGQKAVKVTMTNYTSGDARWEYTPQVLTRGKDYRFTAWYKTNTIPHVVVRYLKNNNTEDFLGLPDPIPTSEDWQQYSGVFNVPQNVKSISVYFFLTNVGWVTTDDYHIVPYEYVGFDRPIVTLTFDDAFETNVKNLLPILAKYGLKVTYCYSTKYVEGIPEQEANVLKISKAGNETCSHSVNHLDMSQESKDSIDYELSHSKEYLAKLTGQKITDFLAPFGAYNTLVSEEIKKYYQAHRTTDEGYNSKDNLDPYKLQVQNMKYTTTLAQFKQWVNKAKTDRTWLILVYHELITGGSDYTEFDTKKTDFEAQMKWLASSGVEVKRMDEALKETIAQIDNNSKVAISGR